MRILKAKACVECGKEFMPRTNRQITCNEECRKKHKRAYNQKRDQERRSSKKLTSLNKPSLTIEEIMRIGRVNGIYSYGKAVQAIERGEIE